MMLRLLSITKPVGTRFVSDASRIVGNYRKSYRNLIESQGKSVKCVNLQMRLSQIRIACLSFLVQHAINHKPAARLTKALDRFRQIFQSEAPSRLCWDE